MEHIIRDGDPWPQLADGDVWTCVDDAEYPAPPVFSGVTDFIFRAGPGVRPRIASGRRPNGEDSCCIRVMDGCDRFTIMGFDLSNAYHCLRITGSAHCRVLHMILHDAEMEGMLCGAVDFIEIGWVEAFGNGGRRPNNDRGHGIYAPTWNTRSGQIHDIYCHDNPGSGLQLNGTAEIRGVDLDEHVWHARLINNGVEGTPNLSLIGVRDSRFRDVVMSGNFQNRPNRGGACRVFADGGRASQNNRFFGCRFDGSGLGFSLDCQENTSDTLLDAACVITGPAPTASGGADMPVLNAAIT